MRAKEEKPENLSSDPIRFSNQRWTPLVGQVGGSFKVEMSLTPKLSNTSLEVTACMGETTCLRNIRLLVKTTPFGK